MGDIHGWRKRTTGAVVPMKQHLHLKLLFKCFFFMERTTQTRGKCTNSAPKGPFEPGTFLLWGLSATPPRHRHAVHGDERSLGVRVRMPLMLWPTVYIRVVNKWRITAVNPSQFTVLLLFSAVMSFLGGDGWWQGTIYLCFFQLLDVEKFQCPQADTHTAAERERSWEAENCCRMEADLSVYINKMAF